MSISQSVESEDLGAVAVELLERALRQNKSQPSPGLRDLFARAGSVKVEVDRHLISTERLLHAIDRMGADPEVRSIDDPEARALAAASDLIRRNPDHGRLLRYSV